ncbi:MAG: hypothetical protein HC904_11960 [Blastochloris sp.]|nr:hypothetical protein [Blastochloris sp.]
MSIADRVKTPLLIGCQLIALSLLLSCAGPSAPRSASGTRIEPAALVSAEQTVDSRGIPRNSRQDVHRPLQSGPPKLRPPRHAGRTLRPPPRSLRSGSGNF